MRGLGKHRMSRQIAMAVAATVLAGCGGPPPAPPTPDLDKPKFRAELPATAEQQLLRLDNGLAAYVETLPIGSDSQVQLAVLAGSLFVTPGLAELAANVLLQSSDPANGQPSLKRRIEALGGRIEIRVGLMTTWFDIRISTFRLPQALVALRNALDSVTQSRSQIGRMRSELVQSLTAEIQTDPIPLAARLLLHAVGGTGPYLHSLLDVDPSEVSLFHSRLYRPDRCLMAIATPRRLEEATPILADSNAMAGWLPAPPVPGVSAVMNRTFQSGLYWANVPGRPNSVRTAIVMRLPDATMFGSAEWLVMHSCLTLGGRGGRLERMQDEAGLSHVQWQSHIESTPDTMALVMSATVKHTEAADLWRVLNRARQSLVDVPPTKSELQIALRRAMLNADLASLSNSDRLRLAANMLTRGAVPGGLMARLQEMTDPATWDPRKAATAFQETPAWMVVVGAGRPDDMPGVVAFDLLPEGFKATAEQSPTPAAVATTSPWLTRARAAMGGGENFAKITGFTATSTVVADRSPTATDTTTWLQLGKLTRKRQVLAQTITTELDGNEWSESMDAVRKSLEVREAKLLRHEMMRHPMMLLAAEASGSLLFRPIAQRSTGDRELMVLEAVGDEFDRLRIHIDTESYLIRAVESWERLPDETLVHVRETWSDYRSAGAMRAPHRCRTTWNDGEHQTETLFSDWRPLMNQ
jgi:predicted Zn-dependent peptidase